MKTRSCSLWEDKCTTLFQVCCTRVNIFPFNFIFTHTREAMSQFGMDFIHVINFYNVHNVRRISVMFVIIRVRIFLSLCRRGGRWSGSCLGCSKVRQLCAVRISKASPLGHTLSSLLQNFKVATPLSFPFLHFYWSRCLYPSRFMSKPSLNHVSVINSSQIRKSCRNSSIFGGGFSNHGWRPHLGLQDVILAAKEVGLTDQIKKFLQTLQENGK